MDFTQNLMNNYAQSGINTELLRNTCNWIVLDIETYAPAEEHILRAIDAWKPPANTKDLEKIEKKREEAAIKIREKSALLDAAPIACITIKTELQHQIIFNGLGKIDEDITAWTVVDPESEKDEASMLVNFREFLNTFCHPDTALVGHNIKGFDLPKLRLAYIRNGLRLPEILDPRTEVVDLMKKAHYFSSELSGKLFYSLEEVARVLGIPSPKQVMSGADVPVFVEQGKYAEVLAYSAVDVATETKAFTLMYGLSANLK